MIDPWRRLDRWNKPLNTTDEELGAAYREAMQAVAFASDKVRVLHGTTTEVIDQIADKSLDFAYVDGDHTLRGITIDLVRLYPKIRPGGHIGGDDFEPAVWHHGPRFEPTLVFPLAVYFAEAVGAEIWALDDNQFLLRKPTAGSEFAFHDPQERYARSGLLGLVAPPSRPLAQQVAGGLKRLVARAFG